MRILIILLTALALCGGAPTAVAGQAVSMVAEPKVEARLLAISEEMRCLVCQNETLAASRAELANDLRAEIRRLIIEGKTDAEIKDFLVARYGDFVLYRPPLKSTTWLLWFGPFVLLAVSVAALLAYLRKRATRLAGGIRSALSDDEKAQVRALLGESEDKA